MWTAPARAHTSALYIVNKNGTVQKEPFLDLTKTNPLGSEVQTGFVEQGLWDIAFHPPRDWRCVAPCGVPD